MARTTQDIEFPEGPSRGATRTPVPLSPRRRRRAPVPSQ